MKDENATKAEEEEVKEGKEETEEKMEQEEEEENVPKRAKLNIVDKGLINNLPSAKSYEISYMHRDVIDFVIATV